MILSTAERSHGYYHIHVHIEMCFSIKDFSTKLYFKDAIEIKGIHVIYHPLKIPYFKRLINFEQTLY